MLVDLVYFGIASLMATLSGNLATLMISHFQQAITGAFLATNGLALTYERVPADRPGSDLGLLNAAVVLTAAGVHLSCELEEDQKKSIW